MTIKYSSKPFTSISFVGYFAIKIAGTGKGSLYTGLFADLASSTVATLSFLRAAHSKPASAPFLATGVLLAGGTMFPRMLLIAVLLNQQLLRPILVPAAVMAVVTYGTAFYYWLGLPKTTGTIRRRRWTIRWSSRPLSSSVDYWP